jgi:16S rRNA (cytosine967-C5)-methyltransferase
LRAESDPQDRLLLSGWPTKMAASLVKDYGDEAIALDEALCAPPPLALRANTLKTNQGKLLNALKAHGITAENSKVAPHGIVLTEFADVFALPEFKDGHFEVQDEASQLVAELIPAKKSLVIDYCAGAGGKTLAIAALLNNRGRIIACDPSERRLEELARRARRAGVSNVQCIKTGDAALKDLQGKADAVLVDVPCSGTGVLRRKPDIRLRLSDDDLGRYPEQQKAIVLEAVKYCAIGGRLIYSTCSILSEENEHVVGFLTTDGKFSVLPASDPGNAPGLFLRYLPHVHGTDGFFAAIFERKV